MENGNIFNRSVARVKSAVAEISIEQRDSVKTFVRTCQDGWQRGWHESNGGNLSYRLDNDEAEHCRTLVKETPSDWVPFGVRAQGLANEVFLFTAAGSNFHSISDNIASMIGIVEINQTGDSWRCVWGLKNGGHPTSELLNHFMLHAIRKVVSSGTNRVVYHTHPENVIALSLAFPLDSRTCSQLVWTSLVESILVIPEGIGVSPWMAPGSVKLAEATGILAEKHPAILWPQHGLLCVGDTLDSAFGMTETIDKAAGIYVKARSLVQQGQQMNGVSVDQLREAAHAFGVSLNEEFLV